MQFTKRNISKQSRNGEIILTRSETFESSTSSSNVGGGVSGNYLPATQSEDGKYVVDLANVQFTGNIYADGEVSAYGQGGGGTTSSGNTEIIDALSSSSVTAALSANQGRVLNDKIITLSGNTYNKDEVDALIATAGGSGGTANLENYYTKEQTYSKEEVDEKISGVSGNYLPANKNDDGSYTVDLEKVTFNGRIVATSDISAFGEGESTDGIVVDLSNYYTKDQVYNTGETYNKAQIEALFDTYEANVDLTNYYTKTQTDSKITSSLSGYATQTWVQNQKYLTGLPSNVVYDEDLANYFTKSEINNTLKGYSVTGHNHHFSALTTTAHTHTISQVTNLQTTLNNKFNTSGGTISGDLYVTGKIIAEGEISAYGEGESGGGTSLDLSNYYTKDQVYNTGETYNKAQVDALIATNTGVTVDLSDYYTKTQTDSKITSSLSGYATESWVTNKGYLTSSSLNGYATQTWVESKKYLTGYTLPSNVVYDEDLANYFTKTEVNNKLAGYSPTSHNHHFSALTSTAHTHAYSSITNTGHTHSISNVTNLQSTLDDKSDVGHTHAYSELTSTAHTHAYSSITNTGHTHSISNITNLQTTLDGKSGTGHSHNITALTSGKCAYNLYVKKSAAQVVCENSAGNVISLHNDSNRGIYDNTTSKWMIGNNGTNTFLQLGLVGIGTQSPTYKLTVEGGGIIASGNIIAGGEVTALSDARLKKNITPLENVGKLNPVRYIKDGKPSIGFVAQDVRELYPELVEETNTEEKYLSVNYPQITAVLASQINELYDVIDKLKKEIKELKNK